MILANRVHFSPLVSSVLETPGILGRLAEVKLQKETSSQKPNLRRCLGHHGVFQKCLTATQEEEKAHKEAAKPIVKEEPYPTSPPPPPKPRAAEAEAEAEPQPHPLRAQALKAVKAIMARRPHLQHPIAEKHELARVPAHSPEKSFAVQHYHAHPKVYFGINHFARLRRKMYDKTFS